MRKKRNFIQRCIHVCKEPKVLLYFWMNKQPRCFNDEEYLRTIYRNVFGKELNLKVPKSFNEKLNWLKLNDRNPLYTVMADKYWVKKYVSQLIGEEYVVTCYGHWKSFKDIDFNKLPDRFFLKFNHNSQKGVLVDKKAGINYRELEKMFAVKQLGINWYWPSREWPYKNIEPCILAEEFLDNGSEDDLQDYKFWCFNGKPMYMYITNKGDSIKENFYDMDFSPVAINHGFPRREPEFPKPGNFEKMKQLAAKLSVGIPFVRVDFYNVYGRVFFGEFTFYDWGGMQPFDNDDTDIELGKLIDLTKWQ